ncbi:hypothetical protein TrCOL_g2038 [Triparma columacea]|uniref:Tetratricopeptide repeat protein n=1 Tax=Triparma columacea TaxID=722753 RepID=A0A9W7GNV2_9STRA|nr:hypothetical protein TrCOL_g2038 [Triparma columacea]
MDAGLIEGVVRRAVLDLAESDDTTDEGRARVENAIKIIVTSPLHDKNNAMVKNHLANHFFYVYTAIPGIVALLENSNGTVFKCSQSMDLRQGDRVLNFAKAGFHATKEVAAVRAESCWLMGRVYQVQGEYEDAEKFYHQAVKLDSSFSPALFSYSEVLVRKTDYIAAVECLEKVLKTIPNSPDTQINRRGGGRRRDNKI